VGECGLGRLMRAMVVHVEVVGNGRGDLEVSWEPAWDGPVEVAVGPSPESIRCDEPVARVEGATRVSLQGLGPGRHYVSVAPVGGAAVVAAERLLRMEGLSNFRDLGGYRTADGGRVRWGLVYRSDAPHLLTPADLEVIARLGLRTAYDLRTDEERAHAPSVLPEGVRREWIAISGAAAKTEQIVQEVIAGQRTALPGDFLVRVYHAMAETEAAAFGRLLTGLAEPGGLPALIHCTAGKDRTGIGAALLLSALGVDERTVLDDYELSAVYYSAPQLEQLRTALAGTGIDVERFRAALDTSRQAMAAVLATLKERHGTIENYLLREAGVSPDVLAELRARLVQRPG